MKEIKHIGVVGEGKMGTSIFFYLSGYDFRLAWLCSSEAKRDKARKTFSKKINLLLQCGVLTEKDYVSKQGKTVITAAFEDLKDCDLVIEAITEDIGLKRKLFESLDKAVNIDCIFTTNSSSVLPLQLFPSENRKDRFCGLHFFFPVAMKSIVELIARSSTSLQTKALLNQFLSRINKKPFHQDEANAFILNRLFLDFQAGAYQVFLEGRLSYQEIDELVRKHLFPIGVFEFFDHVGIDVMLSSVKTYTKAISNKAFYAPLIEKMEELVKLNHLGIKTKRGFYDYAPLEEEGIKATDKATDKAEDKADYKRNVTERLWDYYIGSVIPVIESGSCSREDLAYAVKDYMGMDSDPFKLPSFNLL
ncbi:MAG: 3-hydroxyacyl-CoA dehydrogenase family protein [Bacteroidales bacterium]|nr:3-hydroxyacyl-CoA dehydrogenase family protein [Bacteroidales bacterium]